MPRFRHLLLCLMMLALPLQGFASASMLFCGMGLSLEAKYGQQLETNHHHVTDPASVAQHDHSKHGKVVKLVKQSPEDVKQLPDSAHTCGVCASCCGVVALAEFPWTVQAQALPSTDLPEPFVQIRAVPSRLLEKPPRA